MNPLSEAFVLGPLNADDVLAYAPALPFAEAVGADTVQSFDPNDWPNLVIVGAAGLGKTNAIKVLAAAAREQGAVVYVVGIEDTDQRFDKAAYGLEAAEELVQMIHGEIRNRLTGAHALGAVSMEELAYEDRPRRIFLFVDDLNTVILRESAPEGTDERARDTEYRTYLAHSIDKFSHIGQFARVHLIVTVTDHASIPEALSRNSSVLDLTPTAAADTGAAHFTVGRGRFTDNHQKDELSQPVAIQIFSAPATS